MSPLIHRALASDDPRIARARDALGRLRDRVDHPQLRDARRLLTTEADVLLMGESVLDFVGPDDADQRNLPTMVADLLLPRTTLAVHGGGYHVDLLAAYVRLVAAREHRPSTVVVPLWARGRLRPWIEHPRFGHHDALRRLAALDPLSTPWRIRGSLRRGTPQDFETYYEIPYRAGTIGDFSRPLKGSQLVGDERLKVLYDFHHGGPVEDLDGVTRLGAALQDLGVDFFAYETPISVATGERVLGPGFRATVEANFAAMGEAFRAGAPEAVVLSTGTAFEEDCFIDPADGSEHLNEQGRTRLARLIVDQIGL